MLLKEDGSHRFIIVLRQSIITNTDLGMHNISIGVNDRIIKVASCYCAVANSQAS